MKNIFKMFCIKVKKTKSVENFFDVYENVSIQDNTKQFLYYFESLIKTGNQETVRHFIKFITNSIQGELVVKCFYNDRNYPQLFFYMKKCLLLDLDEKHYKVCKEEIDVKSAPIISSIWNNKRIIENLSNIGECNGNSFDGLSKEHKYNINAVIVKPLNFVLVTGGNHSVNSAIIHNEGKFMVERQVDITPMLEKYKFDGIHYRDIKSNEKVEMQYLVNKSQPLLYSLGLLFEMARIINDYKTKVS